MNVLHVSDSSIIRLAKTERTGEHASCALLTGRGVTTIGMRPLQSWEDERNDVTALCHVVQ